MEEVRQHKSENKAAGGCQFEPQTPQQNQAAAFYFLFDPEVHGPG